MKADAAWLLAYKARVDEMKNVLDTPSKKPHVPFCWKASQGSSRLNSSMNPRLGAFVGAGLHPSTAGATNVGSGRANITALDASPQASTAHVTACFHIYSRGPSESEEVVHKSSQIVMVCTVKGGEDGRVGRRGRGRSDESENRHEEGGHSSLKHRKAEPPIVLEPMIVDVACRLAPRAALSIE